MLNSSLIEEADYSIWEMRDPRVEGWLLLDSPQPLIMMILSYLTVVIAGPIAMKNVKPFNIISLMVAYNLFIVILSVYIVSQFVIAVIRLRYNWLCDVCNPLAVDSETMRIMEAGHLYMLTKPLEWLDSLFFILRKKDKQLSFLHVYHHCSIFPFAWIFLRWVPSGSTFVAMFLNTFVHIIMYTYYTLAAFGNRFQKYLWWKRYLTMLQLAQFMIVILHPIYQWVTGCNYPFFFQIFGLIYVSIFLILFSLFYQTTYTSKAKQPAQTSGKEVLIKEIASSLDLNNIQKVPSQLLSENGLRHRTMVVNF